jgi:hypothetical protein
MSSPLHARSVPPQAEESLEGRTLEGRYRVESKLGEGGLGTVYRAQHLKLAREVAIKVLRADLRAVPQIRARFEREVRALSALAHPNIVTITDFGVSDAMPFLVMELCPGTELSKMVGSPMPAPRAIANARQILASLAYAHERDVVHRDLKPANVIVRTLPDGRDHVTVLDFGLAKFIGDDAPGADLTRSGLVVGTPAYMPPEQMAAGERKADARSDIYALGLILFEMLTGRRVFSFDEPAELLRAHLVMQPPTLTEALPGASVDPRLEAIVSRALAKSPAERFSSAKAMIDALDALPAEPMLLPGAARATRVAAEETRRNTQKDLQRARHAAAPTIGNMVLRALVVLLTFSTTAFGIAWAAATQSAPSGPEIAESPETAQPTAAPPREAGGRVVLGTPSARDTTGSATPQPVTGGGLRPIAEAVEVPDEPTTAESAAEAFVAAAQQAVAAAESAAGDVAGSVVEVVDPVASVEPIPDDGLEAPPPEAIAPTVLASRPPARNPMRGRMPRLLDRLHDRVLRGRAIGRGDLAALTRYRNEHPSDPRARLLLGHTFVQRGWLSAALDQYERAFSIDPSSRGDPTMLAYVVRIARTDSLHARASEMVLRMYGHEAREAVQRAIDRAREPDERQRLLALRARIG